MISLITGANRGIGAQLLEVFRASSPDAFGTSRDGSTGLSLDVLDQDSLASLGAAFNDKSLDLLVCNAGIFEDKGKPLSALSAEDWARAFAINVTGVAETIRVLLPALQRAPAAKIAIISSQMASQERAPGGSYIYRASKAAVLNFGRNLAQDLKPDGIAVGIYHPGWVRTDMGGQSADISVEEAATGLAARFEHLSMQTTGCFETWDGRAHPF